MMMMMITIQYDATSGARREEEKREGVEDERNMITQEAHLS